MTAKKPKKPKTKRESIDPYCYDYGPGDLLTISDTDALAGAKFSWVDAEKHTKKRLT